MRRILVDDARTFADPATIHDRARTPAEAHDLIAAIHGEGAFLDELWLDYDLGEDEDGRPLSTEPVLDQVCGYAAAGTPLSVGVVVIHTSDPAAARTLLDSLHRYGYRTRRVTASDALVPDQD